jgi:hypothetical protein
VKFSSKYKIDLLTVDGAGGGTGMSPWWMMNEWGMRQVELKWGQGAKNIGGEVKVRDLKKAQLLYERGYVVLPNPTDPHVIEAFERGSFKEFERQPGPTGPLIWRGQ